MKNNKGFTLIELLAVMVIIAIIGLITVPAIIGVIDKARKEAFKASVYGVVEAGELYYIERMLSIDEINEDIVFKFPDVSGLKLKGTIPSDGSMKIYSDGEIEIAVHNGKWCAIKNKDESQVVISDDTENCHILESSAYKNKVLNGADPELGQGMIPVIIESDGTVKKADLNKAWYKYEDKKWANVVLVEDETLADSIAGSVIPENKILAYLVWIPRFKYQLFNTNNYANTGIITNTPRSINIVFQDINDLKETWSTNDAWLTHPAFTFGNELKGFWVGKFETGYRQNNNLNTIDVGTWNTWSTEGTENGTKEASKILIKPNIPSWRDINIKSIYDITNGMSGVGNIFGLSTGSDSHLIKNMEWGAIAYLSHSIYGINNELRNNNSNNYITGCASNTQDVANKTGCGGNDVATLIGTNNSRWNTATGYLASTTGNITGVYDMSGGTWEYVMGFTKSSIPSMGSGGFTLANITDFTTGSRKKYMDLYTSTDEENYGDGQLGDATKEMGPFGTTISSWYNDSASFVNSYNFWFVRGGEAISSKSSGVFAFLDAPGDADAGISFRIVMLGK